MYVLINKTKTYGKYCILFWSPMGDVKLTRYKWVLLDDYVKELELGWNQKKVEKEDDLKGKERELRALKKYLVLNFSSYNLADSFLKDVENKGIKKRIDGKITIVENLYNNKGKNVLSIVLEDEIDFNDVEIVGI